MTNSLYPLGQFFNENLSCYIKVYDSLTTVFQWPMRNTEHNALPCIVVNLAFAQKIINIPMVYYTPYYIIEI